MYACECVAASFVTAAEHTENLSSAKRDTARSRRTTSVQPANKRRTAAYNRLYLEVLDARLLLEGVEVQELRRVRQVRGPLIQVRVVIVPRSHHGDGGNQATER